MRLLGKTILLALAISLVGCQSYKKIPYMKDSETFQNTVENTLYDARIMPKDLLVITVNSTDPEAAAPFNLNSQARSSVNGGGTLSGGQSGQVQNYMVDNDGNIEFPVLGKIHLGGLTKTEAEKYIVEKLRSSFKEDPIVIVRSMNYKISVLGEVNHPGTFTVANEKINMFEALALAGDMTIYGRRNNVKLLRENENGSKEIVTLDMNQSNVINSPYFYLQQNDIIYVEPNKAKANSTALGTSTTFWISISASLISIANLLVNIIRIK